MGSIVKSIGKAIKKVAKGIKKVIKKIGPALIIAAAVYAGVAFYGSTLAGASGATLGPSNFMNGLSQIGTGIKNFFSPTGGAAAGQGVTAAVATPAAGAAPVTAPAVGEKKLVTFVPIALRPCIKLDGPSVAPVAPARVDPQKATPA